MDLVLPIIGWSAYGLAIVAALILNLVGLFGNWIILGASAIAWAVSGFTYFSLTGLLIMLVLAVLGEVVEAAAAGYGAKRFGGGKGAMAAALIGCILGSIAGSPILPIVGTLIGACIGAFAGAALYEFIQMERQAGDAIRTGLGAAAGRVMGLFAKFFVGILMLLTGYLTLY